jgi:hypothetical protein
MRHCTVYRTVCRYSMPNFINLKNSVGSNFAYGTLVRKTRYYCTLSRTKNPKIDHASLMSQSVFHIRSRVSIPNPEPLLFVRIWLWIQILVYFLWYGTIPVATGTCSSHQCSAWNHRYICTCRYRYSYLQSSSVQHLGLDPQILTYL